MTAVGIGFQTQTTTQVVALNSTATVDFAIPANSAVIASGIIPAAGTTPNNDFIALHGPHPTDSTKWRFQMSIELSYGGTGYPLSVTCWMITSSGADWYNVMAYGAKGDGATDDHAAIQAAINAANTAGGGTVYLPAATYYIGGRITPKIGVTVVGAGIGLTILKSAVTFDYVFYSSDATNGISDFTLKEMTIDVNNASHGAAFRVEYATRVTLERVRILNVPTNGWGAVIGASGTAGTTNAYINFNITIKDCFFDVQSSTLEQLLIMNSQHVKVLNCDFANNTAASGPGIGIYQVCDDIQITNSTFRSIAGSAIYYSLSCNNITISDCAFYGSSGGGGIAGTNLSDNGAFGAGWSYGLRIANCYFTGLSIGVQLGATKGAIVDNCHFEYNYNIGIHIHQGNQGVSATPQFWNITNCRFRNNNTQTGNGTIHPGILLANIGGSQYGRIANCTFWDDSAGGVHVQICPISFSGAFTWDYVTVDNCYLEQYANSNYYQQLFAVNSAVLGAHVFMSDCRMGNGATTLSQSVSPSTINAQSSSYTINNTDDVILATGGSGGITITLPAVSSFTGKKFTIIKADNGAGAITIATTSSQTINGATTQTLASQYNKMAVQSDGTVWWIINT